MPALIWLVMFSIWLVMFGYNHLLVWKVRVNQTWKQLLKQLQARQELVPRLIEVAKQHAPDKQQIFERAQVAREKATAGGRLHERGAAEYALSGAIRTILALEKSHPALKADPGFANLQKELDEVEEKIVLFRDRYNDTVKKYNAKLESFLLKLLAKRSNKFSPAFYFQAETQGRKV